MEFEIQDISGGDEEGPGTFLEAPSTSMLAEAIA
jgi:hypothetical protein